MTDKDDLVQRLTECADSIQTTFREAAAAFTQVREERDGLRDVRIPSMRKHWGDALNDLAKLEAKHTRLREALGRIADEAQRGLDGGAAIDTLVAIRDDARSLLSSI